jgi:hypothetical protein
MLPASASCHRFLPAVIAIRPFIRRSQNAFALRPLEGVVHERFGPANVRRQPALWMLPWRNCRPHGRRHAKCTAAEIRELVCRQHILARDVVVSTRTWPTVGATVPMMGVRQLLKSREACAFGRCGR